jgi:hypothetical protein
MPMTEIGHSVGRETTESAEWFRYAARVSVVTKSTRDPVPQSLQVADSLKPTERPNHAPHLLVQP